jgi:hypothetical protein
MLVNYDGLYIVLLIITLKDKLRVMMLSLALKLHDSRREIPLSKLNLRSTLTHDLLADHQGASGILEDWV